MISTGARGIRPAVQQYYSGITAGVTASYAGITTGLYSTLATLQWAIFQCPVGYWIFPELPAVSTLAALRRQCVSLQAFVATTAAGAGGSPPPTAGVVTAPVNLTDNTSIVIAMQGTTSACSGIVPLTFSVAAIVDFTDVARSSAVEVTVGGVPGQSSGLVDVRNRDSVAVYWSGFVTPPAGTFSYAWTLVDASIFPVTYSDADMATARDSLAWQSVGLAQNATLPT